MMSMTQVNRFLHRSASPFSEDSKHRSRIFFAAFFGFFDVVCHAYSFRNSVAVCLF